MSHRAAGSCTRCTCANAFPAFGLDINFYDSCQKKFVDIANCNLKEKLFLKAANTVQTKYEIVLMYKFSVQKCVLEKYRPYPIK